MEKSFGAYLLGEPLGTLPFGDLVAATHSARSESLALLLLDPQLSGDHRFRGLVRLEMARAGGLRQAGVARMVEISEQSGALAVVYERPASGTSLAARLENGDGPDPATGLHLIDQSGMPHYIQPWLVRRACSKCKHEETYVLDRYMRDGAIMLKSLEYGHEVDASDLRDELREINIDLPTIR